jgi:hypothetical protein
VLQFVSGEGRRRLKKLRESFHHFYRYRFEEGDRTAATGADTFFGEKSFEVDDLMRIGNDGRGIVNILRVTDLQGQAQTVFHFHVATAGRTVRQLPEEGDLENRNW